MKPRQASKSIGMLITFASLFFVSLPGPVHAGDDFFSVPSAPTNLTVSSALGTQFVANWTPSPGATSYRIDVSTSSNFLTGNVLLDVTTSPSTPNSQLVTGLTPGTAYYFRLRAVNGDGTSPNSFIRSLVTPPPAPISYGAAATGPNEVFVAWSACQGATGYRVDVSLSESFNSLVYSNLDAGNSTILQIKKLASSTTYYYRVRAVNSLGISPDSNVKSVTTTGVPFAPIVKPATNIISLSSFQANWSPVGPLRGVTFFVDVAYDPGFTSFLFVNSPAGSDSSLTVFLPTASSLTLYYRVRAYNAYGFSGYSNSSPAVHTVPSSVNSISTDDITLYPNPVNSGGTTSVKVRNLPKQCVVPVTIVSFTGDHQIESDFQTDEEGNLEISFETALTPGTYVLKVQGRSLPFVIN
jgi:hypothetical protein